MKSKLFAFVFAMFAFGQSNADITVISMSGTENQRHQGSGVFVADGTDSDTDISKALKAVDFAEQAGAPFQIVIMKNEDEVLRFNRVLAFQRDADIERFGDEPVKDRVFIVHFIKDLKLMDVNYVSK